jgi:hypothetical protein
MQSEGYAGGVLERSPADVYTEHCRRRQLAYQVDTRSRPPRAVFRPRVGSSEWRVSAGRGTVYATTVAHRRAGDPYNIVLVDLDEGFRMMSTVVAGEPRIGARVRLAWREGDPPVPVFEVAE